MAKQIIIAEQHHLAAVFWEDQIQELIVAKGNQQVSDIYLGIVENVIPGIDAAFVNIGDAERNGFIHVSDLGPLRLRKTAGAITELLSPQQKVLVQVMKEPTGNKGPRLTGNISLPGRYIVLMPYGQGVKQSRRIKNDNERSRLRALAILIKPAGMGLLVRTEAEGKAEEAIMEDLDALKKQWDIIQQQANSTKAPSLLNRDDDFIQKVLRDMYSSEVNRIVVDTPTGKIRVRQHLVNWNGGKLPEGVLVDYHQETQPILDYFKVNAAIKEALKPRVDLPSGGYIIIEPTEALTVIDVNSGSFTRSATSRETVSWTNNEAATEIARQLRLRNIGGVVIVDFIDMDTHKDQLKLLEHFNKTLKTDKARPQIAQLSELGLVELTRKRQGKNIYELFGQTCVTCGGVGHLLHLPGQIDIQSLDNVNLNPVSSISYKPVDKASQEREILLETFDVPAPDTEVDLELTNHPSYQEPPGNGNNRRRRRRRPGDPLYREEANGIETPVQELEVLESPKIPEKKEKERPQRLQIVKREEPVVEKVSVELTPLEQDVYALMGVSPLIRVDKEFKDPKSVLVYVKLPGEQEDTTSEKSEIFLEQPSETVVEFELEPVSTPVVIDTPVEEVNVESKQHEEKVEAEEENNDAATLRRRRRRSSAT